MHKITLTSSALWLFDVINNVMPLTVPEKKVDSKAEQSLKSWGHCDPCKVAKHPGSDPSPIQSQPGCMWLFGCSSPSSEKSWLTWAEIFPHPGPRKSSKFRAPCTVSSQLSKCLWILAQMTGNVCAKWRRLLWRDIYVEGKLNCYFLFYWTMVITKETALIPTKSIPPLFLIDAHFFVAKHTQCSRSDFFILTSAVL